MRLEISEVAEAIAVGCGAIVRETGDFHAVAQYAIGLAEAHAKAARREGKAEGLREAADIVGKKATVLLRRANAIERDGGEYAAEYQRGKGLELAAAALLARAEEVEK